MKKMLLAVSALCVVLFSANSMALSFNAGLKGGLSLGTLRGDGVKDVEEIDGIDKHMRAGFLGYGLVSVDFTKYFGTELDVGFVGKGKKWSSDSDDGKGTLELKFNYLEIPILIKGMVPAGIATPMIYAGPTFGFVLSSKAKEHFEYPGEPDEDTTITIPASERNVFEFGLALGAGSTFNVGPGAIIFDFRYTIGFTSLPKLTEEDEFDETEESDIAMKTGTLAIMLGYQFKF